MDFSLILLVFPNKTIYWIHLVSHTENMCDNKSWLSGNHWSSLIRLFCLQIWQTDRQTESALNIFEEENYYWWQYQWSHILGTMLTATGCPAGIDVLIILQIYPKIKLRSLVWDKTKTHKQQQNNNNTTKTKYYQKHYNIKTITIIQQHKNNTETRKISPQQQKGRLSTACNATPP